MTGDRGRRPSGFGEEDEAVERALRHRVKDWIRTRMRAVRRAVPREARDRRSGRIAEHVKGLPAWSRARVVAGYVAMRSEADPAPLLAVARSQGKAVALPRVDRESEGLHLHRVDESVSLEESGMGFMQPAADAPRIAGADVDLVLVPALAADERGYRIGWGRGFYDRLLPELPNAVRVALVFDFQLIFEVPDTPGDERVHFVVTDEKVIEVPRS